MVQTKDTNLCCFRYNEAWFWEWNALKRKQKLTFRERFIDCSGGHTDVRPGLSEQKFQCGDKMCFCHIHIRTVAQSVMTGILSLGTKRQNAGQHKGNSHTVAKAPVTRGTNTTANTSIYEVTVALAEWRRNQITIWHVGNSHNPSTGADL